MMLECVGRYTSGDDEIVQMMLECVGRYTHDRDRIMCVSYNDGVAGSIVRSVRY